MNAEIKKKKIGYKLPRLKDIWNYYSSCLCLFQQQNTLSGLNNVNKCPQENKSEYKSMFPARDIDGVICKRKSIW